MLRGGRDRIGAAGQRVGGGRHFQLLPEHEHRRSPLRGPNIMTARAPRTALRFHILNPGAARNAITKTRGRRDAHEGDTARARRALCWQREAASADKRCKKQDLINKIGRND